MIFLEEAFLLFPCYLPINQFLHCGSFITKSSKAVNSKSTALICMCRVIAVNCLLVHFYMTHDEVTCTCTIRLFTPIKIQQIQLPKEQQENSASYLHFYFCGVFFNLLLLHFLKTKTVCIYTTKNPD